MPPRHVAPLALRQLAAWERLARDWPAWRDADVWRCGQCDMGIALAADTHGVDYHYTPSQRLASVVLHLRARHADLDPDQPL